MKARESDSLRYILDTDICLRLLAGRERRYRSRLTELGRDRLATTCFTAAELFHAAETSPHAGPNRIRVEGFLSVVPPLSFGIEAQRIYARLRTEADRRPSPSGFDVGKASIALASQGILVTLNRDRFKSWPSLRCEAW